MTQEELNTDSWEDFSGNYIKAEFVKEWPVSFIPLSIKAERDEEKEKNIFTYTGEFQGKNKSWQPNKTNQDIIKSLGFTPKGLIGHIIWFRCVENYNPSLKKRVPAFEIERIE